MKKERFEARLFRIFAQAGYSPVQLLTVTPEEMVEIPGITVPNIRAFYVCRTGCLPNRTPCGLAGWWKNCCKRPKKAGGTMDKPHVLDILAKNRAALFPTFG